jgi:hypothetical protein
MRTGRPKKAPNRVHSAVIRVRVTSETEVMIKAAASSVARRRGTGDLSSWLREVLTTAARRELAKEAGGPKAAPNSTHDEG